MIIKAALLLFRDEGEQQLLFVRDARKPFWVLPGGKQDPGETIEQALQRELQEELGVTAAAVNKLGVVAGQTPDGRDIEMHLYRGALIGEPSPQAEIGEVKWFDRADVVAEAGVMTPMTLEHILPFLAEKKIW